MFNDRLVFGPIDFKEDIHMEGMPRRDIDQIQYDREFPDQLESRSPTIQDFYENSIRDNDGYSEGDDIDNRDSDYTYGIDFDVENNDDDYNNNNENLSEMKYLGPGLSMAGGIGLLDHGLAFQIGFIGTPGSIGRFYFTYGTPNDIPIFLDCSFSTRYNICISKNPTFKNINGNGIDFVGGYKTIGFDYATDNIKNPSYIMIGAGPSIGPNGLKASGGLTDTHTWSIPFYIVQMITPVGGKFY